MEASSRANLRRSHAVFLCTTYQDRETAMKRIAALLGTTLLTGALVAAAAPAGASSYCGVVWGSTPESAPAGSTATLSGLRAGRHACFDRLVLDVAGPAAGYDVRYVDTVSGASGTTVPLRGEADLQVVARVPAYRDGLATYSPARRSEVVDVAGYDTFRQVAYVESFEGQSLVGLGVRARLPFRVFALAGPGSGSRLVVDVAHRW